jgi:hypothetical protein
MLSDQEHLKAALEVILIKKKIQASVISQNKIIIYSVKFSYIRKPDILWVTSFWLLLEFLGEAYLHQIFSEAWTPNLFWLIFLLRVD